MLASGAGVSGQTAAPAGAGRIAVKMGSARMEGALARARAHGLDAMLVQRIARREAGNVGMVSVPARVVVVSGPIAVDKTAGQMESAC